MNHRRFRRSLSSPTLFEGIRVFDGEQMIESATVLVRGEAIVAVGPRPIDDRVAIRIRGEGKTLLPGFIDTHVHIGLHRPARVLRRGVTTVRDLGWPLEDIRRIADRRKGPEVLYTGPMLTARDGYPSRAGWAPEGTARAVGSADHARTTVRALLDAGAHTIKVAQDDRGPTLDEPTLRAIVEETHAAGRTVTSHVTSRAQLALALEARVDELAHGLWSDEPLLDAEIEAMVARGMTVVPTLHIDPQPARIENTRRFLEAGGRVVYGTDMGNPPAPGGIDVEELRLMRSAGMEPLDVLAAATARAAAHLGLADRGRIAPGARGDVIMVAGDPLEDLGVLAKPLLVLQAGRPIR